jgi:predicted phosphoadenosine phosphosulfate sulfurtransferase
MPKARPVQQLKPLFSTAPAKTTAENSKKQKRVFLAQNVLEAAQSRIARVFDDFSHVYLSCSAGKDSTTMLHLVAAEARRRGRKFGLLFIDMEAQYDHTIRHAEECFEAYRDVTEPYWISLPLILRNSVSQYQPRWLCWDPAEKDRWVRQPSKWSITDTNKFPWFRDGMEFEEFVVDFGSWYAKGEPTACFVGIRAQESLNRYRTLVANKEMWHGLRWTTAKPGNVFNVYPIYDWKTEDIWRFAGKMETTYNEVYDLMWKAGLTIHQQRLCQPYGDDQRKGLHLFHVLEPQTWAKVVARVAGANSGALYANEAGNMMGRVKITCPPGHNWQSFARILLGGMPDASRRHYVDKITMFFKWFEKHHGLKMKASAVDGELPYVEAYDGPTDEVLALYPNKGGPTWYRVCKMLLKNDWWGKELSFSQTKSDAYDDYIALMRKRRERWSKE